MNPDQQRRNRHKSNHSNYILQRTFSKLIDASTLFYDANIPILRPHQFQVSLHDTHQEIIERLYLFAEDACDILNLYPRPPENDARRIVFSLSHVIEHILEALGDD